MKKLSFLFGMDYEALSDYIPRVLAHFIFINNFQY